MTRLAQLGLAVLLAALMILPALTALADGALD